MMRPFQILVFLLFIRIPLMASDNYPVGARSVALSNTLVSVSDVWSTFHNQATLVNLNTISAGVFYESRFLVDELSLSAGTFIFPFSRGTTGLSFYQFGRGTFKENKIGLAYSKQLSNKLSAALQIDYFLNRFPENEKKYGLTTFEIGVCYQLTNEVTLGAHVFNPVKSGYKTYSGTHQMPVIMRIGGHYVFNDHVLISSEFYKNTDTASELRLGIEFFLIENLALRMGVSGKTLKYSAGLGYRFNKFTTDIAFSYHGNLGFTPSVSVQFNLE